MLNKIYKDSRTLKVLARHPFKLNKAMPKFTARCIESGSWCERTANWAQFWIVTPGDYGFNDGIEIVPGFNLYGEC